MEIYTGVNEQLKRLLAKAEELDWSYNVWIETERNNRTYAEMEKYSPAGEDFIMIIDFNAQNQAETFLKDLQDYAENFDIEDHVEMWMQERGKGGCPSTLKELMEDAEAILAMIKELTEELTGIKEQGNEEKAVNRRCHKDLVGGESMLDFVTINTDGVYIQWSFESIEDLRKAYHSEEEDVPGPDDPVADMCFCGVSMYADSFDDIVRMFGIEEE